MSETELKAIIVAAGLGRRLNPYTAAVPKCLLDFGGKTLLERQIEAYRACGVTEISLIRGYKGELFDRSDLRYFDNDDFENNNILNSIFYAEAAIRGDVIIGYSDILFDAQIPARIVAPEHDLTIVVDTDWREYYVGRRDHPIEEAENVIFDNRGMVVEIGKILNDVDTVSGEFIGMMRLSLRGAEIFKEQFHRAKSLYWDKPFQRAPLFQKAYLTDMIQEMVDQGILVHCVTIQRGWKEIDTVEDYEKALAAFGQDLHSQREDGA